MRVWDRRGKVEQKVVMRQEWKVSYHTHNEYCDGAGGIEEMVQAAIDAGLQTIGISSHAPLPFSSSWNMSIGRLDDYIREVHELQQRYRCQITILLGAELDYIPDARVREFQEANILPHAFDYFIGSVHYLGTRYPPPSFDSSEEGFREVLDSEYHGDIVAMTAEYYRRVREMLTVPNVRIIGHLDLIKRWNANHTYFQGDEAWYVTAVDETLRAIATSGHIVELNTAGWRRGLGEPYPAGWILERCLHYHIPVTINADAHMPAHLTWGFDRALAYLAERGITPVELEI
jgi:histidinol-phosphatase (PHP family)